MFQIVVYTASESTTLITRGATATLQRHSQRLKLRSDKENKFNATVTFAYKLAFKVTHFITPDKFLHEDKDGLRSLKLRFF
jgi:hypothetical protein